LRRRPTQGLLGADENERMPADAAHTPIESTAAAYWVMLRRIALAAAAIDLVFLLLYGLLGATALALLNLASIAMYAAA
jgi:hypothetical protein